MTTTDFTAGGRPWRLIRFHPLREREPPKDGVLVRTFPVGRSTVRASINIDAALRAGRPEAAPSMVRFEWDPDMPTRMSPILFGQYVEGRRAFFQEVADLLGKPIALAEEVVTGFSR